MRTLFIFCLLIVLSLPAKAGYCFDMAYGAYKLTTKNPEIHWSMVVTGVLPPQQIDMSNPYGGSFGAVDQVRADCSHAACVWEWHNQVWTEDIMINGGEYYLCPTLTKYLNEGKSITPQLAMKTLHWRVQDIEIAVDPETGKPLEFHR